MCETAILRSLLILILSEYLRNATPGSSHIKLNLGLTDIDIRVGMSAMEDEEQKSNHDNDTVLDPDGEEFRDVSLWFDPDGICLELVGENYEHPFDAGTARRAASTPAVSATVSGGSSARRRLSVAAVLPALLEGQDESETFLSKMIQLILECHDIDGDGDQAETRNKLIVDKDKLF